MSSTNLVVRGRHIDVSSSILMGVVNVNDNSFSDPHSSIETEDSISQAISFVEAGASIVDIGAQSLSSKAELLEPGREIEMVVPVIEGLLAHFPGALISLDTFKPEVAAAGLEAGAAIVNDVSGLREPSIAELCGQHGAALVVAHMPHRPKSPASIPKVYPDICSEVKEFLEERANFAISLGVSQDSLILDPGPDFGKTPSQTIELLRRIDELREFDRPMLLAISRKDFLGAIVEKSPKARDAATFAAIALLAATPGNIFRVHDVAGAVDVIKVVDTLLGRSDVAAEYSLPDSLRHE